MSEVVRNPEDEHFDNIKVPQFLLGGWKFIRKAPEFLFMWMKIYLRDALIPVNVGINFKASHLYIVTTLETARRNTANQTVWRGLLLKISKKTSGPDGHDIFLQSSFSQDKPN